MIGLFRCILKSGLERLSDTISAIKLPETEHSKLPWKVITWGQGNTRIVDANDDLLYGDIDNAPFIVEACNSHDALVARVKELEDTLRDVYLRVDKMSEQLLSK